MGLRVLALLALGVQPRRILKKRVNGLPKALSRNMIHTKKATPAPIQPPPSVGGS